jgi:hypothetical protein
MALTSAFVKRPAPNPALGIDGIWGRRACPTRAKTSCGEPGARRGRPRLLGDAVPPARRDPVPCHAAIPRPAMMSSVGMACLRPGQRRRQLPRHCAKGDPRGDRDEMASATRYCGSSCGCADPRSATRELRSAKRAAQRPSPSLAAAKPCHPVVLPELEAHQRGLGGGWRVDGIALTWSDRSHQGGPREVIAAPGERTRQTA